MTVNCNLPVNAVSFGQLSTLFLREVFNKKDNLTLFPIGNNIDLSTQDNIPKEFGDFITSSRSPKDGTIAELIETK